MKLLLASSAHAWWNNGHLITARVAYDELMENEPDVLKKAEGFLEPFKQFNKHEQNHTFVECATFADDIKNVGFDDISPWHYTDQPFFDKNFTKKVEPAQYNVTGQIAYITNILSGNQTLPSRNNGVTWAFGDAFHLRLLIHYLGDIHQPLHTVSRFTQEHPDGDRGGNDFMLKARDPVGHNITNLHALWDSGVYEFEDDVPQPLTETSWQWLGSVSDRLRKENTRDKLHELLKKTEIHWADEGYKYST